jgi:peroxiredoxin
MVGKKAPEIILKDLDGKEVKLSQFKDKPLILDFFATFSKTSQKQILVMEKLNKKYNKQQDDKKDDKTQKDEQQLIILGITSEKYKEKVKRFVTANKLTFPILVEGIKTFKDYKVTQLPTVLFITKDGNVCSAHFGVITYNEPKFDAEIKSFLPGITLKK